MFKKIMSILLIALLTNVAVFASETKKGKDFAEKVKSEITKLGTGSEAKVNVKLKDGTKIKGYVTEIKADSFFVMNEKTSSAVEIPYTAAKQVKGNNLSKGVKIALGIGLIAALIAIIVIAGRSD